jgi:peptidyl-dipeptidase Dcp
MDNNAKNPLILGTKVGKYEAIPFDQIEKDHFLPAFEHALKAAKESIDKIRNSNESPTFINVCEALETSGELLGDVSSAFFTLMGAESDDEFKELAQTISPMLAAFGNSIMTDPVLFSKVKTVYDNRESLGLNKEQMRLVNQSYLAFVRNGALLSDEDKKKLGDIDGKLSQLGPRFTQNVMRAVNSYSIHITDKEELKGLPPSALEAAEHAAKKKNLDSGWLFNLQIPSYLPVITYAENRALREKMTKAYATKAFHDKFDNSDLVVEIANLRHQRANLLGFKTHAEYVLAERMAESPETVMSFLDKIYDKAYPVAVHEMEELQKYAKELDNLEELKPWDTAYYGQKLKEQKFKYNEEDLRPYFKLEDAVCGLFTVAKKLYGLSFLKNEDIPVYHPEVEVYEVSDENDQHLGLLYLDLHPRETKRGGAWMAPYRKQGLRNGKVQRPHISIAANLSPSTDKSPSLLQHSEVRTLFHEFGHALHGLLSDCYYSSLASPSVYWDFVELPSQIMENWIIEKEALDLFAKHYQTGEKMPEGLVDKIIKAQKFNVASMNIRQLGLGYLDMAWHAQNPASVKDVDKFEDEVAEKTRLLPKIENSNTSCSFSHIFAGGYSAGYYSYKWAEVLEADAYELFKERGIFDRETASSFRNQILAKGNSEHPMALYERFRGRRPDPDALLRRDGLI